jgi:hypothetical protein
MLLLLGLEHNQCLQWPHSYHRTLLITTPEGSGPHAWSQVLCLRHTISIHRVILGLVPWTYPILRDLTGALQQVSEKQREGVWMVSTSLHCETPYAIRHQISVQKIRSIRIRSGGSEYSFWSQTYVRTLIPFLPVSVTLNKLCTVFVLIWKGGNWTCLVGVF